MASRSKGYLVKLVMTGAALGTSGACAEPDTGSVFAMEPIVAVATPDPNAWAQLELVDINTFPPDEQPRFHAYTKTFFRGPDNIGQLVYCIFQPTWNTTMPRGGGMGSHYHTYWEWGYTLKGDSALTEPVSPDQKNGMFYRKSEGGWLTRPPYSLHGGGWATGGKRAQFPYHLLIWEEGDGSVVTVGPNGDHFFPDWPDQKPDPYLPDWQSVEEWTRPWLVNSMEDLEWEDDPEAEGRLVKWLDDDIKRGFRSQLVKIPPGWTPPEGTSATYFENANRMRYLIYGDMTVWLFDGPGDDGPRAVRLEQDSFVYQPARSIWGYGAGPVSEKGAIWLEVTYAHGVAHSEGPIEAPRTID